MALAMVLAAPAAQAGSFFVTSGPGSDTRQIDADNPLSWTFTAGGAFSALDGAVFALKYAPGTTYGIRLQVEDLANNIMLPGGILALSATAFNALAGGEGDAYYTRVVFDFTGTLTLSSGDGYRISLMVDGDPQESTGSYTVRGNFDGVPFVETTEPDTIVVASDTRPAITATPEPSAALLLPAGLLALAAFRSGRRPLPAAA